MEGRENGMLFWARMRCSCRKETKRYVDDNEKNSSNDETERDTHRQTTDQQMYLSVPVEFGETFRSPHNSIAHQNPKYFYSQVPCLSQSFWHSPSTHLPEEFFEVVEMWSC